MKDIRKKIQKGENLYEKKDLVNKVLVLGVSVIVLIIVLVSMRSQNTQILAGIVAVYTIVAILLIRQIISIFRRTFLVFDDAGVIYNGKRVKYNELISVSTYHIQIIQDKKSSYSETYWTEEYYYRCFSLDFKVKDILIGYLFEESAMGLNEINDKHEIKDRMKGYSETYRNSEPYIYMFSEDDFQSIYERVNKQGIEIKSIRK